MHAMARMKTLISLFSLLCFGIFTAATKMQTFIVHMDSTKVSSLQSSLTGAKSWPEVLLESVVELSFDRDEESPQILYTYGTVISGFAVKLTEKQAKALEKVNGFLAAYPDELLGLHTTYTPHFLGLQQGHGLWSYPNLAADVVVGVIDTGIWPEHPSFGDVHVAGFPERWKGTCEGGTKFSRENCNKKIIGARAFWQGYEAFAGGINETREYRSARDSQGHGTHTASTAAGNVVDGASLCGYAKGAAAGMRFTSRIAVYKACWASGCASSDILAAVDTAVADGVDVLSLSLGGISRPYYADNIAIAAFGAIEKGVFFTCSAGNSGPFESTVSNIAPWIMTVAASYVDRSFPTQVALGDGRIFRGASLYPGKKTKSLTIVYNTTAGKDSSARFCINGTLSPELVKGKLVLCERGINGRTEKGEQVRRAGGSAMILLNTERQGEELYADAHVLPASSIGAVASSAVKNYTLTSTNPTATMTFLGTVYGEPAAPMMTAFSSRGPSLLSPEIIKPDITAPGMSILAAWPPTASPSLLESDERRSMYNIISGTSMSCPHVSGLAALLKSAHPDWSPGAIKSAFMTTAYVRNDHNSSIINVQSGSPATPFDMGSGHVDPELASRPGLVYDIAVEDYLNYLCSLNYTASQVATVARRNYTCPSGRRLQASNLNYPSLSVVFNRKAKKMVHSRTLTNVGPGPCKYVVKVSSPAGVSVRVQPKALPFEKTGQKLSYKVKFVSLHNSGADSFGDLVWVCGEFSVRSPIAVTWQ